MLAHVTALIDRGVSLPLPPLLGTLHLVECVPHAHLNAGKLVNTLQR